MSAHSLPRLERRLGLILFLVVTALMSAFAALHVTKARSDRLAVVDQQVAL